MRPHDSEPIDIGKHHSTSIFYPCTNYLIAKKAAVTGSEGGGIGYSHSDPVASSQLDFISLLTQVTDAERERERGGRRSDRMAERYVKLSKDQGQAEAAPLEDIRPGELNLPVQVPQLAVKRCSECGQQLPESYVAPADEPWTSSIFDCMQDTDSCWTGLFCPCVLFGRNVERLREDIPWTRPCLCHAICVEGGIALAIATAVFHGIDPRTSFLIGEGLVFSWWVCGIYTGLFRQSLQKKYHLKNSPCDPCAVHCCMHWCAICQEHREMKSRLSDNSVTPMTVVNPPPVQEMNANQTNTESASDSGVHKDHHSEHVDLEMQPM